jgi:hypothetical protein
VRLRADVMVRRNGQEAVERTLESHQRQVP